MSRVAPRSLENGLVNFTIAALAVYVPIEVFASAHESWKGLVDPFFIVDLIGMTLLTWGVVRSRRARPRNAVSVLAAGWGWCGANFWRAGFGRLDFMQKGGQLVYGAAELCFVLCGIAVALGCLVTALVIAARSEVGDSTAPR